MGIYIGGSHEDAIKAELGDKEIIEIIYASHTNYAVAFRNPDTDRIEVLYADAHLLHDWSTEVEIFTSELAVERERVVIPEGILKYITRENCQNFDEVMAKVERQRQREESSRKFAEELADRVWWR